MFEHYIDKINNHEFKKGVLISPMNKLPTDLGYYNWRKEAHPEFIWISLIMKEYGRKKCFLIFEALFPDFLELELNSLKFSEILNSDDKIQSEFYKKLLYYVDAKVLSPLTLLFSKKDYPVFNEYFLTLDYTTDEKIFILDCVLSEYGYHDTDESTDIRFLSICYLLIKGRIKVVEEIADVFMDCITNYANCSHENVVMRRYRPMIRSLHAGYYEHEKNMEYIENFWKKLTKLDGCKLIILKYENEWELPGGFIDDTKKVLKELIVEYEEIYPTEDKFNVIINSTIYSLKVFIELVENNLRNKIIGRMNIRIILEVYIILKFLKHTENETDNIWKKYILYGIGKYKLIVLKAREYSLKYDNSHLNSDYLEYIINEPQDEMFTDIEFKYFEKINIREKANVVNEKELYDMFYDYESNYAHGLWGAIRESSMSICYNETHLCHSIPDIDFAQNCPDVLPDAYLIIRKILKFVNEIYPIKEEYLLKYEVLNV